MSFFTKKKKHLGKKTFSYFIPAPPKRKTGYQEKELDKITSYLNAKGFDILDIKTQSIAYGENQSSAGIWVICLLGILNENLIDEEIDIDYLEISQKAKTNIELTPDIVYD